MDERNGRGDFGPRGKFPLGPSGLHVHRDGRGEFASGRRVEYQTLGQAAHRLGQWNDLGVALDGRVAYGLLVDDYVRVSVHIGRHANRPT